MTETALSAYRHRLEHDSALGTLFPRKRLAEKQIQHLLTAWLDLPQKKIRLWTIWFESVLLVPHSSATQRQTREASKVQCISFLYAGCSILSYQFPFHPFLVDCYVSAVHAPSFPFFSSSSATYPSPSDSNAALVGYPVAVSQP